MNSIRLARNISVRHDAMKMYGGAETAPPILFYLFNGVEVSGYGLVRGADTELTWPA